MKTEILAGLTTFMTMSYILFANPAILGEAGVPVAGAQTATALGAALATAAMAAASRYPFALAPGMGLNAFLAYTVCRGLGYDWEIAMAVVVVEGLLLMVLVGVGLRRWIMDALPLSLKHAIGAGIGAFIAFIGLKMAGIVTASGATLVTLGPLGTPEAVTAVGGLVVTATLLARGVPGALLIGIVAATLLADLGFGLARLPASAAEAVAAPNFSTVWKFWGGLDEAVSVRLLPVLFALLVTDFFDTMGTVIAVGSQGGFVDRKGSLPRLDRVLMADSGAAALGGALGCSSITTYLESASGVAAGGRGPVVGYTVAACFLLAMFFNPLAAAVPACAVAPALIVVGWLMMRSVARVAWERIEEGLPAFLVLLLTPLTFSISTGVGWGVLATVGVLALSGGIRRIHPALWICAAVFALSFSSLVPR